MLSFALKFTSIAVPLVISCGDGGGLRAVYGRPPRVTDHRVAYVASLGECECPSQECTVLAGALLLIAWTHGLLTLEYPETDPVPPTPASPAKRRNSFDLSDAEMVPAKAA